jgi:hypothetical protein
MGLTERDLWIDALKGGGKVERCRSLGGLNIVRFPTPTAELATAGFRDDEIAFFIHCNSVSIHKYSII